MGIQRLSQRPFGDASRVSLLVPKDDNLRDVIVLLNRDVTRRVNLPWNRRGERIQTAPVAGQCKRSLACQNSPTGDIL
eukprot:scaffold10013_cov79-Skeletonema_dohrnii-CCMP3373.AAC.23